MSENEVFEDLLLQVAKAIERARVVLEPELKREDPDGNGKIPANRFQ